VTKQEEVDPDEERDGDVSVLRRRQARHNLKDFGIPYNNEQHEYYQATV
jgi:hypothetical protein